MADPIGARALLATVIAAAGEAAAFGVSLGGAVDVAVAPGLRGDRLSWKEGEDGQQDREAEQKEVDVKRVR